MRCENCLVLLLEADREELEGLGKSEVAMHVRDCAQCGAVAARLMGDTQALAAHVESRAAAARRVRRSVVRPFVFGGTLAAAAAIALLLMPARAVRVAPPPQPPAVARVSRAPAPTALAPQPLVRIRETRFADAVAATPVRLVASHDVAPVTPIGDSNGVSVIPPAGMRSAVLATRNEKITVVWLY